MTTEHYRDILSYLRRLFRGTVWEGHVYAVGGCCRDALMGREIKDIDLAVERPNGGIELGQWLFERGLTVNEPTEYPMFGTSMLRLREFPDDEIEIVQTRAEQYSDATIGDPTIVYGSKEIDALRRDLTVNALYHDISADRLLDLLGTSAHDIEHHIVRTPVDPVSTFEDDPVRILRAIRLAARYGWPIQEETLHGMRSSFNRIRGTRPHRIMAELERILLCDYVDRALELMRDTGVLTFLFPELEPLFTLDQNQNYGCTSWEHTLQVIKRCPADLTVRMAALLHDAGKPKAAHRGRDGKIRFTGHERQGRGLIHASLRRLYCDRDFIDRVIFLVANQKATAKWGPEAENMTDEKLRMLQFRCQSPERFGRLMALIDADNHSFAQGHGMPLQVEHILRRSDELRRNETALFHFRRQLPDAKVRKLKGLPAGTDMTPYHEFLFKLALTAPELPVEEVRRRLRKFTPQQKSAPKHPPEAKPKRPSRHKPTPDTPAESKPKKHRSRKPRRKPGKQ
ncbi:MAG: HD domain-containing protein [Muribaculaceae bacterium]|nr:HD domain-containing protein [Muribaculaceae bacterium]